MQTFAYVHVRYVIFVFLFFFLFLVFLWHSLFFIFFLLWSLHTTVCKEEKKARRAAPQSLPPSPSPSLVSMRLCRHHHNYDWALDHGLWVGFCSSSKLKSAHSLSLRSMNVSSKGTTKYLSLSRPRYQRNVQLETCGPSPWLRPRPRLLPVLGTSVSASSPILVKPLWTTPCTQCEVREWLFFHWCQGSTQPSPPLVKLAWYSWSSTQNFVLYIIQ